MIFFVIEWDLCVDDAVAPGVQVCVCWWGCSMTVSVEIGSLAGLKRYEKCITTVKSIYVPDLRTCYLIPDAFHAAV